MTKIGVVVIGRNEGERLRRCLESVRGSAAIMVYVDSGSTDGSVDLARSLGAEVVELDMRMPFTAARARNTGFQRLIELMPELAYAQLVDGDCELHPEWIGQALAYLDAHPGVAMLCGRLRERFPEHSVYNRLCDMEWDTPIGETKACGGIAMVRADAFGQARGFRSDLIAGEEPELGIRLRANGWRIWRIDAEMAWHDAAMFRFGQWWKRSVRAGYAFAEGAHLHGRAPERHWVRESISAWIWGLAIPLVATLTVIWAGWSGMAVLAIYPLQILRLSLRSRGAGGAAGWRAVFLILGKFPELIGQLKFMWRLVSGGRLQIIEYK
ncbi:MAG: glycosyltransferase [Hydrogenophilaceae bacterium]|nr:glycosyltransferase [Hydrogenophilaceae bacterium]